MKKLFVRLQHWEYWPFSLLYFPVFFYYAWLTLKHRSFFFFTASNPSIEFGGMIGEKKSDIFNILPMEYTPETKLIETGDLERAALTAEKLGFPLIAKPDIGERGNWVSKIHNQNELKRYVDTCPVNFLLQEMVDLPIELGVFYVKYPNEKGMITSIVRKEFLSVIGDGKSTVNQLLSKNTRAMMSANLASDYLAVIGNEVPDNREKVLIEPIGNHSRGTMFLNDNHQIDESLNRAFNKLADKIPEFYFGRFDIRCNSYEELRMLKNIKILELNGAGAEPAHIYQPGYSLWKAYKDIFWHLSAMSDISYINKKRGHDYWGFNRGLQKWKDHKKHNKLLANS